MGAYSEFISPYAKVILAGSVLEQKTRESINDVFSSGSYSRTIEVSKKISKDAIRLEQYAKEIEIDTSLFAGKTNIKVTFSPPYQDAVKLFGADTFLPGQLLLVELGYSYAGNGESKVFAGITSSPVISFGEEINITLSAINLSVLDFARGTNENSEPLKYAVTNKPSESGDNPIVGGMSPYNIIKDILSKKGIGLSDRDEIIDLVDPSIIFYGETGQRPPDNDAIIKQLEQCYWVQKADESYEDFLHRICRTFNLSFIFEISGNDRKAVIIPLSPSIPLKDDKINGIKSDRTKFLGVFQWMGQINTSGIPIIFPIQSIDVSEQNWWAIMAHERLSAIYSDQYTGILKKTTIEPDKKTADGRTDSGKESTETGDKKTAAAEEGEQIPIKEKGLMEKLLPIAGSRGISLLGSAANFIATMANPYITLTTIGIPDCRLGQKAQVTGTQIKFFDKFYYVIGYLHKYSAEGFTTSLTLATDIISEATNELKKIGATSSSEDKKIDTSLINKFETSTK